MPWKRENSEGGKLPRIEEQRGEVSLAGFTPTALMDEFTVAMHTGIAGRPTQVHSQYPEAGRVGGVVAEPLPLQIRQIRAKGITALDSEHLARLRIRHEMN